MHTPGPWRAYTDGRRKVWLIISDDPKGAPAIALDNEDDANLVAAAPAMLATLIFAQADPCWKLLGSVTHDEVRAAIAKATGTSQ